jgi:arylsulfatase A-like enzyme
MAAPGKPNIVYILVDDLGYADAGFSGNQTIKTPNLDRLAKEGTVLDCLYGQPTCSPTRAALLTGRYPVHTGVYTVIYHRAQWGLPLQERTLAEALREGGYETAIVGKWHLGAHDERLLPTRRGFDHQYGHWFGEIDYFTHMRDEKHDWRRDDVSSQEEGYTTRLLADEACAQIRRKHPGKPLFLYLAFNAVHMPLQVPAEYEEPYRHLSGEQRTYAAMVSAMDAAVGQVVAALQETGMRENTLIVFSSDNGGFRAGEIADNHPLRAGKGTLYEGGIRLSSFANWPGRVPAGRHIDEPLHVVDWFPTFARLAGLSSRSALPLDGKDIWEVISSDVRSPHEAILISGPGGPLPGAIRVGDFKLLIGASEKYNHSPKQPVDEMRVELYNLAADRGEKVDLAAVNPEKVAELRARFNDLIRNAVEPENLRVRKATP